MIETTPLGKMIDWTIIGIAFVFNALALEADWPSIGVAIGGSFSGAIILAYFRRDHRKGEQMLKVACSAIGGLVLGTVLQEYLQIGNHSYRLGLFFTTAILSLIVLRALLSLTEDNAADAIRGLLQRVFNLQLKEERTRRRVARVEKKIEKIEEEI